MSANCHRSSAIFIFYPQIRLQAFYILFESFDSLARDPANSLRVVVLELLRYFNISHIFEFIDLNTQIAGGGVGLFPDKSELSFFHTYKKRNNSQPELRMQYGVEVFKHETAACHI